MSSNEKLLSIIKFTNSKIEFDKNLLEQLLLHSDVRDRKIVLFAIVGAFRQGKSFFLDYCLRYLYANYKSVKNTNLINHDNWMGASDAPLEGFSWRSGTQRDTTGIIFWHDVFLCDKSNGEKLAILVTDSQGLFDNETSFADNSKIFSLVTLLTSIEVLNLQGVIQEDQLQYLQFATEFAKFTSQSEKPFQNLVFLIRDWNNPDEFDFGIESGQRYLDDVLQMKPNQPEDIKNVREFLKSSFDKLSCALLPYPGKIVARKSDYDGRWASMDEDFLNEFKPLIENLLKAENLTVKKINGFEATGTMANDYFQQFVALFQSNSLVQPQSIFEATVDKFMTSLVNRCYEIYKNQVNSVVGGLNSEAEVDNVYTSAKTAAIATFDGEKKMGNPDHFAKYREILNKKMENDSNDWKAITLMKILRVREEQRRAEEAAREAERIRKEREEAARIAQEQIAQAQREAQAREAEAARQREIIRQQEIAIAAEQECQRVAEEQKQREIAEQQRIAEQRRQEEENNRRKKKKKKCCVM